MAKEMLLILCFKNTRNGERRAQFCVIVYDGQMNFMNINIVYSLYLFSFSDCWNKSQGSRV